MRSGAVLAGVFAALLAACGTSRPATSPSDRADRSASAPTEVLLIGDSIMDQEGGAAALVLNQRGITTRKVAHWGSGMLTRDQYDNGRTVEHHGGPADGSQWIAEAEQLVDQLRPALVVVAMNHNYPGPHPRDAQGVEITDLTSDAGRAMIATQTEALLSVLRAHGAQVAFVTPPPDRAEHSPTDNPIWAATAPVLAIEHVPVIDIAPAVSAPDGSRVQDAPDCRGADVAIRNGAEVHYTRYGAGRAGTLLAQGVARLLGKSLDGDNAPGDHSVALVSTATGRGYWIVQCDGSVFAFGDAAHVPGAAGNPHEPFVAAVRAPKGLWLVARDGAIVPVGGAPARAFPSGTSAVVAATNAGAGDVAAVTAVDDVVTTANQREHIDVVNPVAIADANNGSWVATRTGRVVRADGAPALTGRSPRPPVAGIASTRTRAGAWLVGTDGTVAARGDATDSGDAVPATLAPAVAKVLKPAPPIPVVAIAAATGDGYWIMRDNGDVVARGGAPALGGTAGFALFTA